MRSRTTRTGSINANSTVATPGRDVVRRRDPRRRGRLDAGVSGSTCRPDCLDIRYALPAWTRLSPPKNGRAQYVSQEVCAPLLGKTSIAHDDKTRPWKTLSVFARQTGAAPVWEVGSPAMMLFSVPSPGARKQVKSRATANRPKRRPQRRPRPPCNVEGRLLLGVNHDVATA